MLLQNIFNLYKSKILEPEDLEKNLLNLCKKILKEIASYQKFTAEYDEKDCRIINYLFGLGDSVAGKVVTDIEQLRQVVKTGHNPVFMNFSITHDASDFEEIEKYSKAIVVSTTAKLLPHKATMQKIAYLVGDLENSQYLEDIIHGAITTDIDEITELLNKHKNELLTEGSYPKPYSNVFVDPPNHRLIFGKVKIIEHKIPFFEPDSDHNYQKIYTEIFNNNNLPRIKATTSNPATIEGAGNLDLSYGIFKTDFLYYGEASYLITNRNSEPQIESPLHENYIKQFLLPALSKTKQDEFTMRYIDFFAPEHNDWIQSKYNNNIILRESIDERKEVYVKQTRALIHSVRDSGYKGHVEALLPHVTSFEEAAKAHDLFSAMVEKEGSDIKDRISFRVTIETLDAAKDIKKLAEKFNLTFTFGDLASQFYKIERGDTKAISEFKSKNGFDPFKTSSKDFQDFVESLVIEAKKARPDCKIIFGGDQLNADPGLAYIAVKHNIEAICITPNEKNHAAAIFNLNIAALLLQKERQIQTNSIAFT